MNRFRFRRREPIGARLLRFFVADPVTGCWNWTGAIAGSGYGKMTIGSHLDGTRKSEYAHRVSYREHRGAIAAGLEIDHLCRNRRCVNPAHLEAVTARENTLRSDNLASRNHRKTECKRGHPLAGENVVVRDGERLCRTCQRMRSREWKRRNPAPRGKQREPAGAAA